MSKSKTTSKIKNDYIREELEQDIDTSAAIVVERVAKKGVQCEAQNVYRIRNLMRQSQNQVQEKLAARASAALETRRKNKTSLAQNILNVLSVHPEGLSDRDLAVAVKKAGYTSRAVDFLGAIRQKLHDLVESGDIAKNGLQYKLLREVIDQQIVQAMAPAPKSELPNSDYDLLRESLVDYAKAKGFVDPETFPDVLISQRRKLVEATLAYSNLFSSGPSENAE